MYADADEVNTTQPRRPFWSMSAVKWCVMLVAAVALHSTLTSSLPAGCVSKKPVTMKPALLKTSCTSTSAVALAILSR